MPRHGLRNTTIQACILNVASTILAQLLKFWKTGTRPLAATTFNPVGLDPLPVFQFLFWCLIATPPNYKWQEFLEAEFPGKKVVVATDDRLRSPTTEKAPTEDSTKLDLGNTAKKFLLDQTLGALANNAAFVFGITLIRGGSLSMAVNAVDTELWSIMWASYKFWPLYSIFQFTLVPPERRIVMGSIAGLFWNIFLVLRVT